MGDPAGGSGSSSKHNPIVQIKPELEDFAFDSPSDHPTAMVLGENAGSSAGTGMRSSFIAMGFTPAQVDRAIEENGKGNVDLILETLFAYSACQNPNADDSDSVDCFFGDNDEPQTESGTRKALHKSSSSDSFDNLLNAIENSTLNHNPDSFVKEEPDVRSVMDEKREALIRMRFSIIEVKSAMDKLGVDAPINDLVDFILAARMAEKYEKGVSDPVGYKSGSSTEALFGTMEKTLKLFEMGFSEAQVSLAIDKCGVDVPISKLAAAILAAEEGYDISADPFFSSTARQIDPYFVKAEPEASVLNDTPTEGFDFVDEVKGKRPQEKSEDFDFVEKGKGKRAIEKSFDESQSLKWPKEEFDDVDLSISGGPQDYLRLGGRPKGRGQKKVRREPPSTLGAIPINVPKSWKTNEKMQAPPPYVLYGSPTTLNHESWYKISQFLYTMQPELVGTESFSSVSRQEGYVHNLPTENRFHALPRSPRTIEEALPRAGKWWPSWDTRKHMIRITCETAETSQVCERIGRLLEHSRALVVTTQKAELLQQLQNLNLIWVGENKVAPMQPEDVELLLGYPMHHTQVAGLGSEDRLKLLRNCFQVDTLAYHLSSLKSLFPQGLTLLSIYTGIGGAEVALHKLGIHIKVLVSVEECEINRRVLKHWWEKEGIRGELVQVDSVRSRLGTAKLEGLIKNYQGFDVVIGRNPCKVDNPNGIDFTLFYEFVRAVQRVRTALGRGG